MKKLSFHPLFIVLCFILLIFSRFDILLSTLICVMAHESAHYFVAKSYGYKLNALTLMPYGAVLSGEGIRDEEMFPVAIAGPALNLFFALIIVAMWWVFPSTYNYTLSLFRINIALGAFNLLPLYPLDGGRIALSFCKDKAKALKRLKLANFISSCLFMVLFIISCFWKINFTLGVASIMLFAGGMKDGEKEKYYNICYSLNCLADFSRPVKKTIYKVSINATLSTVIKCLRSKGYVSLEIVDNTYKTVCILSDYDLDKMLTSAKEMRSQTIANYLKTSNTLV
ncbi:hypothetical protein EOM82_08100 [bacterium]|nr:hypothetical protein [bacterium]